MLIYPKNGFINVSLNVEKNQYKVRYIIINATPRWFKSNNSIVGKNFRNSGYLQQRRQIESCLNSILSQKPSEIKKIS